MSEQEIRVGQRWRSADKRFPDLAVVVEDVSSSGVLIKSIERKSLCRTTPTALRVYFAPIEADQ